MMLYNFYIQTNQGLKNFFVESTHDFECAPFGFVPYRVVSSCQCEPEVIEDFWRCVDLVLAAHNLNHEHYVRAVRAYKDNGDLCGEIKSS